MENKIITTPELEIFARELHRGQSVELIETETGQLLSVPESHGRKVIDVREITDEYRDKPRHVEESPVHRTTDSFLTHVARFRANESVIYADPTRPGLTAIYDYHVETNDPRYCLHRASLALQKSKEWIEWERQEARGNVAQDDFAQFLEDIIEDVRDPSASPEKAAALASVFGTFATPNALLTLKDGLSLRAETRVTNAVRLSSGEATFSFEESHTDKEGLALRVPGAFFIAIPVFEAGPAYLLAVRLRYRLAGGRVTWSIAIRDRQKSFDDAFEEVVSRVRTETELPVFIGSP